MEAEWRKEAGVNQPRIASARSVMAKRRTRLEASAAREDDPDERTRLMEQAAALAVNIAAMDGRVEPSILVEDATPPALVALLADHGRLLMLSDEGGHLLDALRRYRFNAGALDLLLKAYSSLPLREARISRAGSHVAHPALAIGVLPQPALLHDLVTDRLLRERGILGRFLLSAPPSRKGTRASVHEPIDAAAAAKYSELVSRLLAQGVPADGTAPVIAIEGDALEAFDAFARDIDERMGDDGDLEPIDDWAQKVRGHAARLAGILHVLDHGTGSRRTPIALTTVERAIQIARYALAHAQLLLCPDGLLLDPDAALVMRKLHRHARTSDVISLRTIHRTAQRRFRAASLRAILESLERLGVIRPVPPEKTGGRTGDEFEIHPALGLTGGPGDKSDGGA